MNLGTGFVSKVQSNFDEMSLIWMDEIVLLMYIDFVKEEVILLCALLNIIVNIL